MSFAGHPAQPERVPVVMRRLLWSAALLLGFWLLSALFSGSATAAENHSPADPGLLPGIGRLLPDSLGAPVDSVLGTVNGVVTGVSRPLDRVLPGGKAVSEITRTLRRDVLSPVVHTLAPVVKPVSRSVSPLPGKPSAPPSPVHPGDTAKPLPGKDEPAPVRPVQTPVQMPTTPVVTAPAATLEAPIANADSATVAVFHRAISRPAPAPVFRPDTRDDSRAPASLPADPDNPASPPAPLNTGGPGASAIPAVFTGSGPAVLSTGRIPPGPEQTPLWRARKPGTRPG